MDDPDERAKMGAYGRARVHHELSWHVTSQNLLKAYRRLFPKLRLSAQELSPDVGLLESKGPHGA